MLLNILSIILNIVYFVVINTAIYTDTAVMPAGGVRKWQRSPVDRLNIADQSFLLYLQIIVSLISVITSILLLFGVNNTLIKKIQLIALIGSTAVFGIIMLVTANINVKYS